MCCTLSDPCKQPWLVTADSPQLNRASQHFTAVENLTSLSLLDSLLCVLLQGVLRKMHLVKDTSQRFTILDTMSTILYPGRFTLLLGPPGAGKTTLLNALSGRLHKSNNVDVSWYS